MSLALNLKNEQIRKILIIKINYVDIITSTVKSIFVSNYACNIYDGITSGDMLNPEIRIDTIPSFIREIDLVNNETLVKSSYNINIFNNDNFYDNLFLDNIFINQDISFYITTENDLPGISSTYGEFKLLAKANISESKIGNSINISFKELSIFEKDLSSNFFNDNFNFENMEDGLDQKLKYIIEGEINNYPLDNINFLGDDLDGMVDLNITTVSSQRVQILEDGVLVWYYQVTLTEAHALTLRTNLKAEDSIYIEDSMFGPSGLSREALVFIKTRDNTGGSSVDVDFLFKVPSYSSNTFGKKIYYISDVASVNFNNRFFITNRDKTTFASNSYSSTTNSSLIKESFVAQFSNGWNIATDNWIQINDNWSFLKQNDIVTLIKSDLVFGLREDLVVDYFDPATKKIYFLNDLVSEAIKSVSIPNPNVPSNVGLYRVQFNCVNSITIKDVEYKNKRGELLVGFDDDASYLMDQVETKASVVKGNITYTSTKTATLGNIDNIIMLDDLALTTPYTPYYSTVANINGGVDYYIYFSNGNTLVSQMLALSITGLTSSTSVPTTNPYTITLPDTLKSLSGGKYQSSYFIFTFPRTDNSTMRAAVFYYKTAGSTEIPTDLLELQSTVNAANFIAITYTVGMNTLQLAQVTSDAINDGIRANNINSPYSCYVQGDTSFAQVKIKFSNYGHLLNEGARFMDFTQSASPTTSFHIGNNDTVNFCYFTMSYSSLDSNNCREAYLTLIKPALYLRNYNGFLDTKNNVRPLVIEASGNSWNKRLITYQSISDYQQGSILIVNDFTYDNSFTTNTPKWYFSYSSKRIMYQKEDTNSLSVNSEFTIPFDRNNITVIGSGEPKVIPPLEIDEVFVSIRGSNRQIHDLLKELLDTYGITEYEPNDLLLLKNHTEFRGHYVIDSSLPFYKVANQLLVDFNLSCYVDNNGILRFKFIDLYDKTGAISLDYYAMKDVDQTSIDYKYIGLKYSILHDYRKNTYTDKNFSSSFLNSINNFTKLTAIKEFKTNIQDDFFNDIFNGNTYEDLYKVKFFNKFNTVSVFLDQNSLDLDINTVFNIVNHPTIPSTKYFKIFKIENNFETFKITAMQLP